jgi:outer membrane protein assembly factor BamB
MITRYFCLLALLIFTPNVLAQDWSQWRGPARDGVVSSANTPTVWPASFSRSWRVELGEGYSSPVVANGRIFVHSRQDPEEIVSAVSLSDGKVIWQQKYPATFQKNQYAVKMAKGPNATPLIIGNRLITLGVTGIVNAWDTVSGRKLWTKDFSKMIDTSKLFCGTAASPLLLGKLAVIQVGSDIHGGQIMALNSDDGAVVWEWKGVGPGYSSPVVIDLGGKAQVVTLTNSSILAIDGKTGAELWSIPFPDEWHENIVTPLWTGTHLIVSGTRQGTHAYKLSQTNGKWQTSEAWKNNDVAMYMSSPVFADGVVYGHSAKRKGQFVALDVATGALRWSTDGREGDHASVLLTPRNVIYLTNSGDLVVAKRDAAAFSVERKYEVAEAETWAMPVLTKTELLVRDATGLMRLTGSK